ncbi:MAG: ATP-binding cassette domain-containing protein, partial [Ancalomicrobiaceae bacterium]|nr:ATP-binding cassette domain-containing protein [Ancalomicrobiaceae bacterium]
MSPLISLRGISKSFDGNAVLKGIDLDIAAGDIIGLVGENGAGKSTCVNIIAGNLRPDHGTLRLEGVDITGASVVEQLGRGIRIIHQELSLAPSLSVAENIFLGSYRAGPGGWVNHRRLVAEASKVLARVRAGHIDPQASVGSLRAGDQQLVEIAKALTIEPRLLIMDEPTSSLTSHETEGLFSLVADLAAAGTAIILIT